MHNTTVRSVAFSPFQPSSTSPLNDILVATESGDVFRWDIRSPDKMLGRLTAAHRGAILGIDWVMDSESGASRSWLCTGGVDRAVIVSISRHSQFPLDLIIFCIGVGNDSLGHAFRATSCSKNSTSGQKCHVASIYFHRLPGSIITTPSHRIARCSTHGRGFAVRGPRHHE